MSEQGKRLERSSRADYVPPDMGIHVSKSCPQHSKKNYTTGIHICDHAKAPNNRFEAIEIDLPLSPPLIDHVPVEGGIDEWTAGFGGKNLVNFPALKAKDDCVVYAIGIANNANFEEDMATKTGCEVHAFDCTVTPESKAYKHAVEGTHFHFHQWCIGSHNSEKRLDEKAWQYMPNEKMVFKTLAQTIAELGHTHIDVLKFDIEGFEWQLFENELLKGIAKPVQMMFELHTEGAKPWSVPVNNVKGRANKEVNNLFLQLHKLGYRVASKELNQDDKACGEFVVVLP